MTKRLELLLLALGIGPVIVDIGSSVLLPFDVVLALELGDVITLFAAPVVVPGLVWAVWLTQRQGEAERIDDPRLAVALLLLGSVWYATGVGLNVGANAIYRQLDCADPAPGCSLSYLLDEHLGHVLWHAGEVVLAFGLAAGARRAGTLAPRPNPGALLGGLAFGFTWFAHGVEGQTVPLMLPASIALLVFLRAPSGRTPQTAVNPVVVFLSLTAWAAIGLLVFWGILHRGFPEFSDVGWIGGAR